MVWSPDAFTVEFRDVPQRHFFYVNLYTLIHFLARYTEVKYQVKQSYFRAH